MARKKNATYATFKRWHIRSHDWHRFIHEYLNLCMYIMHHGIVCDIIHIFSTFPQTQMYIIPVCVQAGNYIWVVGSCIDNIDYVNIYIVYIIYGSCDISQLELSRAHTPRAASACMYQWQRAAIAQEQHRCFVDDLFLCMLGELCTWAESTWPLQYPICRRGR